MPVVSHDILCLSVAWVPRLQTCLMAAWASRRHRFEWSADLELRALLWVAVALC